MLEKAKVFMGIVLIFTAYLTLAASIIVTKCDIKFRRAFSK